MKRPASAHPPRRWASRGRWALVALGALCAGVAFAQSAGGDFTLPRSVIAGGSGEASGGDFRVTGTAGQHDAATAGGGDFVLHGGFWPQSGTTTVPGGPEIFRDGFEG